MAHQLKSPRDPFLLEAQQQQARLTALLLPSQLADERDETQRDASALLSKTSVYMFPK